LKSRWMGHQTHLIYVHGLALVGFIHQPFRNVRAVAA
jgi:hypothetical protein